jgi:hypothetical protein
MQQEIVLLTDSNHLAAFLGVEAKYVFCVVPGTSRNHFLQ